VLSQLFKSTDGTHPIFQKQQEDSIIFINQNDKGHKNPQNNLANRKKEPTN